MNKRTDLDIIYQRPWVENMAWKTYETESALAQKKIPASSSSSSSRELVDIYSGVGNGMIDIYELSFDFPGFIVPIIRSTNIGQHMCNALQIPL